MMTFSRAILGYRLLACAKYRQYMENTTNHSFVLLGFFFECYVDIAIVVSSFFVVGKVLCVKNSALRTYCNLKRRGKTY